MEERLSAAGGELAAAVREGVATVTLDRPAALNALSLPMIEGLAAWLAAWEADDRVRVVLLRGAGEKAFCAGGDVRAIYANRETPAENQRFMAVEYALDHRIHIYPKPIVALIDGIVMGGGMGLAQGAALRVVGERTRMAMPETAIGLFPDVGGSWFLSRLPGAFGPYLALTGRALRAGDALHCGLADAWLAPDDREGFDAKLRKAAAAPDPRAALRAIAPPPINLPEGELQARREAIDRHFGLGSVEAILDSLAAERDPAHASWAKEIREALLRASPTMLKVTLEQMRRAASMPLADCFRMELGMVYHCFEQGDVFEGVRALLVDKDNAPRWNPSTLAEVGPDRVEAFFRPRWNPRDHPLAPL